VLASDGDLMEGISHEAIALAGHLRLKRLIVLFDDNGISIDGPLSLADSVDQVKRFEAAGWAASRIDGHDPEAMAAAIDRAKHSDRPSLIACRTTIGYGAPPKPANPIRRSAPEKGRAREAAGQPPFEYRPISSRRAPARARSLSGGLGQRLNAGGATPEFKRRMRGEFARRFRSRAFGEKARRGRKSPRIASGKHLKPCAAVPR
jgi:transketolase